MAHPLSFTVLIGCLSLVLGLLAGLPHSATAQQPFPTQVKLNSTSNVVYWQYINVPVDGMACLSMGMDLSMYSTVTQAVTFRVSYPSYPSPPDVFSTSRRDTAVAIATCRPSLMARTIRCAALVGYNPNNGDAVHSFEVGTLVWPALSWNAKDKWVRRSLRQLRAHQSIDQSSTMLTLRCLCLCAVVPNDLLPSIGSSSDCVRDVGVVHQSLPQSDADAVRQALRCAGLIHC